jgi:transcriptional regulator with GAF, ATPase, and Fis domain
MQRLFLELEAIARTDVTVMIRGESGTGKELVARALHERSRRGGKPFVVVHCAAIPETLLESELFGHEKGAFTGAHLPRKGLLESADQGTLFLDEIGDLPLMIQPKLLRVLQDKKFVKLGGTDFLPLDLRIMTATHRPLENMVRQKLFRNDLFYRLNVVPIQIPPLRERPEDIPLLLAHFAEIHSRKEGREPPDIDPKVYPLLARYPWPGNVRELENAVQRILALTPKKILRPRDFEFVLHSSPELRTGTGGSSLVLEGTVGDVVSGMIREYCVAR